MTAAPPRPDPDDMCKSAVGLDNICCNWSAGLMKRAAAYIEYLERENAEQKKLLKAAGECVNG